MNPFPSHFPSLPVRSLAAIVLGIGSVFAPFAQGELDFGALDIVSASGAMDLLDGSGPQAATMSQVPVTDNAFTPGGLGFRLLAGANYVGDYLIAEKVDDGLRLRHKLTRKSGGISGTGPALLVDLAVSDPAGIVADPLATCTPPTPLRTDGQWQLFQWIEPSTTAFQGPFTFEIPAGFQGHLEITDLGAPGDRFEVFESASAFSAFATSEVSPGNVALNILDPNAALPDADYSSAEQTLPAGTYEVDVRVLSSPLVNVGAGALRVRLEEDSTEPAGTPLNTDGTWMRIRWFDGMVLENPLTFTVPPGFEGTLDVTDLGSNTDNLSIRKDGVVIGLQTSFTNPDASLNESDPSVAFNDSRWSTASATFQEGSHAITIGVDAWFATAGAGAVRLSLQSTAPVPTYTNFSDTMFSAETPADQRQPDKNPENDELDNGLEFLTGGDPEKPDASPFDSELDSEFFVITYRRLKSIPRDLEIIETSETFGNWAVNPNAVTTYEDIDGVLELVTVKIPSTGITRLFWRIRIPAAQL